jgi:enediyne polyketide synthase
MSIAIVSVACRYPEANNSDMLWQNVLAGRRSFRAIPPERLDLARYTAELVGEADSITRVKAGLLADWQFDCAKFRIPQSLFEATDLTHWLALEVASDAIQRAGRPELLDRSATAVIVANTLTGEFSRAAMLRLRGPFLDDILVEAARKAGLDANGTPELRRCFLAALRDRFPTPQEDMLAGGLANTIAGRVANFFDLHGGAYTVDGACASSLVALANASELLCSGAARAVVVGAVDLSIDPFELVGFSRNGALAGGEMRVFDARSAGFWPGEGAGFAILMAEEEARRRELPVLALLRGWGISTDGAGGFTRPAVGGQTLALQRAYDRAAVDIADVGYVEAHGTGTAVGDPVEVRALGAFRNGAAQPLPIGSIKANIGHTKAAAGFAGLIKTISALETGIIPPHVGCATPHAVFAEVEHRIRPALVPERWPETKARLAGVSGFGFGGINAHVVVEGPTSGNRPIVVPARPRLQDVELFVFAGTRETLQTRLSSLARRAPTLTLAELGDAAADCAQRLAPGPIRVAIVAADSEDLAGKLERAMQAIDNAAEVRDGDDGICVARQGSARLAFLFPGQAAPCRPDGGAWARRFDHVRDLLAPLAADPNANPVDTQIAQPIIAAGALAAWRILRACAIEAKAACGHSLGELAALCWAGVIREEELAELASVRGEIMALHGEPDGGMLRIAASAADVDRVIHDLALVIACHNGTRDIVIAGPQADLRRAQSRCRDLALDSALLPVSHAFHSPMMAPCAAPFAAALHGFALSGPRRPVWSTISGMRLGANDDVPALLAQQLVAPVRFEPVLRGLAAEADVLIEVGPGSGLTRLARAAGLTAFSVDAFADSLRPLLCAIGFAFAATRQAVDVGPLFRDRRLRPIDLAASPRLIGNPCGRCEAPALVQVPQVPLAGPEPSAAIDAVSIGTADTDVLGCVRSVIADETGFAPSDISDHDRFLDDLHLNSIAVGRIVTKAARLSGIRMPEFPSEFANATAHELAAGLVALRDLAPQQGPNTERVPGVRPWVRPFAVQWTKRAARLRTMRSVRWDIAVIHGSAQDHDAAASAAVAAVAAVCAPEEAALGRLIWIGVDADVKSTYDLFAACRAAWLDTQVQHLAICHAGYPVAAFARSLALEGRFHSILVVERASRDLMAEHVGSELSRETNGFYEIKIEADGSASEPHFALAHPELGKDMVLSARDVVLVTGGAKGIGAECALRLAARSGTALILCGRSPEDDPAVAATLQRAKAAGLRCRYLTADVLDRPALVSAVARGAQELGSVTALLHVAGLNEPRLFQDIDNTELQRLLAPKTAGLLAAVEAAGPCLSRIVAFGSILGRMGLKGESHYAIANAWQSAIAEDIARSHPQCRVLSLEWSIWSGAGMGHRLGSLQRLARYGVDAIALEDGIDAFERLVLGGATGTMMVASRFGPPDYVSLGRAELPLLRFIDTAIVHYPHLELVLETTLSLGRDPYLADHRIDGVAVFPGVIGLEAMAQAAAALVGKEAPAQIEAISFRQAIVVPDRGVKHIKIVALATREDCVDVAIRCEDDSFATDCMRATFVFAAAALQSKRPDRPRHEVVQIAARALYGPLLFQEGAFQRIDAYSQLSARRIAASLLATPRRAWFAALESQSLVLGDPGIHDALLHALQAAVPHLRVVPISIERIALHGKGPAVRLEAMEISATADVFTFDIFAFDAADALVEYWVGATFKTIADIAVDPVIAAVPEIAGPYVERVARAATEEASIEVALVAGSVANPEFQRERALAMLDLHGRVFSRSDGKPLVIGGEAPIHLSIAHCQNLTLAVKAKKEIGCDLETVDRRPHDDPPAALSPLGQSLTAQLTASDAEQRPTAITRIWAFHEAAVKQNGRLDLSCKMRRSRRNEVVTFETAFGRTATIHVPSLANGVIVAIGTSSSSEYDAKRELAELPADLEVVQ